MKETLEIKAVEMTRCIRDAHAEQLRGATHEERIAFYNEAARKGKGVREQSQEAQIQRAA